MIFPSLRSPLQRTPPATSLKRLVGLTYLRIFRAQRPDQKTDPSTGKSQEDLVGSQTPRSFSAAAQ
jgi:hypothetical protein